MELSKKWDIYVIHHAHTDIGYTDLQEKIMNNHYHYIEQAIDLLDEIHAGNKKEYEGFVWQCENFWQVENFYDSASSEYCRKFEKYVVSGEIGLSGNYLNFNDTVTMPALQKSLDNIEGFGKKIGHPLTACMTADINGMAWGYAEAMRRSGVKYYYSALHTHHGMFPLYKKTMPFYWQMPDGEKILVWNGDHYHIGNAMFLAPGQEALWMVRDEFTDGFKEGGEDENSRECEAAKVRITRYLQNLESEGYPYNVVPLTVSGVITDNAPPNGGIAARINELNRMFDGNITLRMVTLEEFFEQIEKRCENIPTYRGDWNDWWADGASSAPAAVKVYREAAAKYNLCRKLDKDEKLGNSDLMHRAEKDMLMFAEHTISYCASMSDPWDTMVGLLDAKQDAYAASAHTCVSRNLDKILEKKGALPSMSVQSPFYSVCNPHDITAKTSAFLDVPYYARIDGMTGSDKNTYSVIDCKSGEELPCQVTGFAGGKRIEVPVNLNAGEEQRLRVELRKNQHGTFVSRTAAGVDGVADVLQNDGFRADFEQIETDNFIVKTNSKDGVYSIIRKEDGEELIRSDAECGAFSGIYEITDCGKDIMGTRLRMGRNRKADNTKRYFAELTGRRIVSGGELYVTLELDYSLEGTRMYKVYLKVYRHMPKIEVTVRLHKESRWEPENLYIALPFAAGEESCTYIDKTGCIIRPGIDQLPGTCQNYYMLQTALLWQSGRHSVAVISKDAPAAAMGSLEALPVKLCSGEDTEHNGAPVYSWVMNNFWETNFRADLAGFYDFRYTVLCAEDKTPEEMYRICGAENEGVCAYSVK